MGFGPFSKIICIELNRLAFAPWAFFLHHVSPMGSHMPSKGPKNHVLVLSPTQSSIGYPYIHITLPPLVLCCIILIFVCLFPSSFVQDFVGLHCAMLTCPASKRTLYPCFNCKRDHFATLPPSTLIPLIMTTEVVIALVVEITPWGDFN